MLEREELVEKLEDYVNWAMVEMITNSTFLHRNYHRCTHSRLRDEFLQSHSLSHAIRSVCQSLVQDEECMQTVSVAFLDNDEEGREVLFWEINRFIGLNEVESLFDETLHTFQKKLYECLGI